MLRQLVNGFGATAAACALIGCAGGSPEVVRPVRPAWTKTLGGEGTARVEKVVVDSRNDVVVIGTFTGTLDVKGGPLESAGVSDVFLLKLNPAGRLLWSRRFGSSGEDRGRSVAVDADGNIALTGYFSGEIDFGADVLTGTAENSIFVAKLTGAGEPLWSRAFGDQQFHSGIDLAFEEGGDLYVTGDFVVTADFGGGALTSAGSSDIFVAKFDPDGGHLFSRAFGDVETQQARGLAVTSAGELLLLGVIQGEMDFGGITLTGTVGMQQPMFVAKFDPDMNPIWALPALTPGSHASARHDGESGEASHGHEYADGHSVMVAPGGATIVVGATSETLAFGTDRQNPDPTPDPPRALLQKFGRNGGRTLSRPLGVGSTQDEGAAAVDGTSGNVVVAATFLGELDFGNGVVETSAGGRDLLLSEFDAAGTYVDSHCYGDPDRSEIAWSVAVDSNADVVVGGWSRELDTFGADRPLLVKFTR